MAPGGEGRDGTFRTRSDRSGAMPNGAPEPGSTECETPGAVDPAGSVAPLDLSGLNRFDEAVGSAAPPFDPLRLCVFTTIALIACLLGPIAVLGFAIIAIAGYARARREGLLRSKCKLGDTRLVLAYLSVIAVLAAVATPFWVMFWVSLWMGRIG